MVERIQYVLILLLFVLTGSLEGVSFRDEARDIQSVLTRSTESDSADAVRDHLCVWTHSCDSQAESPAVTFDHRIAVRQRAALRSAAEHLFGVRMTLDCHSDAQDGNAVDYYVFSLGRLLI